MKCCPRAPHFSGASATAARDGQQVCASSGRARGKRERGFTLFGGRHLSSAQHYLLEEVSSKSHRRTGPQYTPSRRSVQPPPAPHLNTPSPYERFSQRNIHFACRLLIEASLVTLTFTPSDKCRRVSLPPKSSCWFRSHAGNHHSMPTTRTRSVIADAGELAPSCSSVCV